MSQQIRPESSPLPGADVIATDRTLQPLTDEEIARSFKAMRDAGQLRQELRARRGGQPLAPSWPILREIRKGRGR
jgi:hypothetical protein